MIAMVIAVSMVFALPAFAVNTVQVTLTSPTIVKTGCEKAGAVTFQFDAGSNINVGDWWYMDLPSGVALCNGINYLITGGAGPVTANSTNAAAAVFTAAGDSIAASAANSVLAGSVGPITGTNLSAANNNVAFRTGGNMALWVTGSQNSRRVTLTAIGDDGGAGSNLIVQGGWTLNFKILDGQNHNVAAVAGDSMILLDSNGNNIYGDTVPGDTITGAVPALQNTLCINAESYAGDLVFVSFASRSDEFTFTGDSQIAHTAAANVITLAACKGETEGEIAIAAQAGCNLDYETAAGYCTADVFRTQTTPYGPVGGNKFIIQGASTLGDAGDQYQVFLYSDTPGVYFTAAPIGIDGYTPTQDPCGAGVGLLGGTAVPAAWTAYNEAGTAGATFPAAGACTIASANRVRELRSATFTGVNTYDALEVDIPPMAYDTSIIGNGTEADIRVSLQKYPCGELFSATRTIGTFVTTCSPAVGTTTLLFPFLPPLDGSIPGWWGGFLIVNQSTIAGTAALTLVEADGDSATLTTPTIAANGGMYNPGSMADLLAAVTPSAGNSGTFGDSNVSIRAVCSFAMGGGFAFTGNGNEGTGYTAYVAPGSGWN
jgi:hypothetical protein